MQRSSLEMCLSPQLRYRGVDPAEIVGPEAAEFLEDAGSAWNGRNKDVAVGALRGALTGFASGGYPGAVLGATGGGMAAKAKAPVARPAAAPNAAPAPTPALPNVPALQMLATMLRPEIFEAFTSMAMGRQGSEKISVAGTPVPVGDFAKMMQQLAAQVSVQHQKLASSQPSESAWSESSGFPAEDMDETAPLLELLAEAAEASDWRDRSSDEFQEVDHMPEWFHQWPWTQQ